jgi:serine/threonine-protein kinase
MPRLNTQPETRFDLFTALVESKLLTPAQLVKADAAVPESVPTAAEAAEILVRGKFLTRFQSERLLAGRTDGFVHGQHVIQEQVGKGSLGRVYRAIHRAMNRTVAIKMLGADVTKNPAVKQAFQREVKAAARLNHPNIVTAYDANEAGDRFYLVLEFVDGPTLELLVRQRGPLPWPEACELIRQAALGLQHAHEHGLVHRDIKPANLLVTKPSQNLPGCIAKIADFGLAKFTAPHAGPAGGITGTPDYIAPEQAVNPHLADQRADLYSLGCVFYFLLTGRPPFPQGSPEEKVQQHQTAAPVPVQHLRPDVPPAVAELVARLMAKDPAQRIPTAAAVAARLDALAVGAIAGEELVSFDLPAAQAGQYSFIAGFSGIHAVETSPWSQLTDETQSAAATFDPGLEETPFAPPTARRRRRDSGLSTFALLGLCATLFGICLVVLGLLIKHAAK